MMITCTNTTRLTKYFVFPIIYIQLKLPDAPVAVGRSGVRIERGVNTSGLLGERLTLSPDPQRNTLVQKKWLYSDDPALTYKYSLLMN